MTSKKSVGITLIAIPYLAITVLSIWLAGWIVTIVIYAIVAIVWAFIWAGTLLLTAEEENSDFDDEEL